MKKLFAMMLVIMLMVSILVLPSIVFAKPYSTWQVYKNGVLFVYNTEFLNDDSVIVYQGSADGYNGFATDPKPGDYFPVLDQATSTPQ